MRGRATTVACIGCVLLLCISLVRFGMLNTSRVPADSQRAPHRAGIVDEAVDTTEWVTVTLAQLPSMTAAEKQIISGAQLELSNAASALLTQGSLRRGEVSFWLHNNPS